MSDFDKEAERERLREKYEQEQADREATEKMSELLLKGATMTNAHCSDCGDPIFRYDGQEFCASCEKAIDRGDDGADRTDEADEADEGADESVDSDGTTDEADDGDGDHIEVATPSEDTRVQFGADASDGQPADEREAADRHERTQEDEPEGVPREQAEPTRAESKTERTRRPVPSVEPDPRDPDTGGGLAEARESLARTLARLSRRAEAAEDPAQAREYLEAAREAAEALAALRR
jgi:uncharacterized Zn finger protein (UPF0148 family)